MLYVYNVENMTDEIEQSMINNENFKRFDNECGYYIAKFDSININGINVKASETFSDFVKNYDYDDLQIKTFWLDVVTISEVHAILMLADDLKSDCSVYEDRIYNANNMWEEIDRCFNELMVRALELAIEELQRECSKLKNNLKK